jgi:hypothetical protein
MDDIDLNFENMSTDIKSLKNLKSQNTLICESNKCKKYEVKENNINDILFNTDEKIEIVPKKEIPKKKKKNICIKDYIVLVILFMVLNNQQLIIFINSKKIGYMFSMLIRGIILAIIYYYYKKLIKKFI